MLWTYEVLESIGSDNDLVPSRWQAIIWTNSGTIGEFKLGLKCIWYIITETRLQAMTDGNHDLLVVVISWTLLLA